MPDCDGFFDTMGIPYLDSYADAAVHAAWSIWYTDPHYAKFLITCWFDTTWRNQLPEEDARPRSRSEMAAYLKTTPYATFEALIAVRPGGSNADD